VISAIRLISVQLPSACYCAPLPQVQTVKAAFVGGQVGWVMRDGLVSFERVRDWEALECQRHICEIQGYEPPCDIQGAPG